MTANQHKVHRQNVSQQFQPVYRIHCITKIQQNTWKHGSSSNRNRLLSTGTTAGNGPCRLDQSPQGSSRCRNGFGFREFEKEGDADTLSTLWIKPKAYRNQRRMSSNATISVTSVVTELHLSGLDLSVNEKHFCDAISCFGPLAAIRRIHRDNISQTEHYSSVSYTNFHASDVAMHGMNGQHFRGHPISVTYAYKKSGKKGERHGSHGERRFLV
jgi:hypothetical protein